MMMIMYVGVLLSFSSLQQQCCAQVMPIWSTVLHFVYAIPYHDECYLIIKHTTALSKSTMYFPGEIRCELLAPVVVQLLIRYYRCS